MLIRGREFAGGMREGGSTVMSFWSNRIMFQREVREKFAKSASEENAYIK